METDLTVALVQLQSGAERRRVIAVDFDYVSRQRKRICDDEKMLLSLIAVSVDDACLPPLYFKIVELCLFSVLAVSAGLLLVGKQAFPRPSRRRVENVNYMELMTQWLCR